MDGETQRETEMTSSERKTNIKRMNLLKSLLPELEVRRSVEMSTSKKLYHMDREIARFKAEISEIEQALVSK